MKADFLHQDINIEYNFITFIRCHNSTFLWRKYSIKALVVSWWRSDIKEVNNWAQCGSYFNANICMISFSKEKISRPLCQIANQRSWPTIYASLYHHSYSTMLKNCKNNSFLHQKLHKGWFAGFFHLRIKIRRLTFRINVKCNFFCM